MVGYEKRQVFDLDISRFVTEYQAGILENEQGQRIVATFRYECGHALCNAHHLRELQRAWEQDKQAWAQRMQTLLCTMNDAVKNAGGSLPPDKAEGWRKAYRQCLKKAEEECPPPDESQRQGKRGRLKRTRALSFHSTTTGVGKRFNKNRDRFVVCLSQR